MYGNVEGIPPKKVWATMICRLLGVPRKDEPPFRAWSDALVTAAGIRPEEASTERDRAGDQARGEAGWHLVDLAGQPGGSPSGGILSAFAGEPGPPCASHRRD
ncbi:hypothetical protein ABZ468_35450 [Streptomyces sp. NPDC005708]|uniref:hypothetical protein n=1 Tax=Streptomyces sp. NPDC005708 TaxID=3154564 RepID=UPI0033C46FFA